MASHGPGLSGTLQSTPAGSGGSKTDYRVSGWAANDAPNHGGMHPGWRRDVCVAVATTIWAGSSTEPYGAGVAGHDFGSGDVRSSDNSDGQSGGCGDRPRGSG